MSNDSQITVKRQMNDVVSKSNRRCNS